MRIRLSLVLLCMFFLLTEVYADQSGVYKENRSVSVNGAKKSIVIVWADLKDKRIRVDSVLAGGKVGTVGYIADMVKSATDTDGIAVAGINGTYLKAYSDQQPIGTIIQDGNVRHVGNIGSVVAFDENGARVEPLYVSIKGGIDGKWEFPDIWYPWNINHYYEGGSIDMLFDSFYAGPKPVHDFTAIEIDRGVVTKVSKGTFNIPAGGFLILTRFPETIAKFPVGQKADYMFKFYENDYSNVPSVKKPWDYSGVRTAIGAGPTLVQDGKIVLDAAKEGFTEAKIVTNAAQRSLVGVTEDGKLGIACIGGVTMSQLAEIAVQLGMKDAMNLDGGASSALYYKGAYIKEPGRKVSNALVIRQLYNDPINVQLNGRPLFFDTEPFIDKASGATLVPLRGIAEALGAVVGWDDVSSSVTILYNGKQIMLKPDSKTVYTDGAASEMKAPAVQHQSRLYVPVRTITELFGGNVSWDGEKSMVILQLGDK
ncbi:MAG: phosphodiester glycosidase family protein [Pseudomonadota bacterium]